MSLMAHFRRECIGWRYWCSIRTPYGWRQVGVEAIGFMDDFGNFVFSKRTA